ncbi:hypothetical protein FJZ31_07155 [Candidatus Poribacteria bacterium]|nr:hypothetical protein [Candidatus Poribacteria bacterium]
MKAYRTYLTITDPERVVLSNTPFRPGEQVEVLFLAYSSESEEAIQALKTLFKETQSLPHIRKITEEEIAAEVTAYRSGR